jgi:diguanylate cyclase (GGDEF)-like protein
MPRVAPYALLILALHEALVLIFPAQALLSNVLIGISCLLAALACYWRSGIGFGTARTKWNLVALGVGLWFVGQLIYAYTDAKRPAAEQGTAAGSDFYFVLYGIPILLAIASSNEDEGSTTFLLIDSFQVVFAVCLTYLQLFSFTSLNANINPISSHRLWFVYLVENFTLAIAATLRLVARPTGEEHRLYRVLCIFLWVYAVFAAPLDYSDLIGHPSFAALLDPLWDAPFLLLALMALTSKREPRRAQLPYTSNAVALVINNGSPILFTFAVLAMGAYLARTKFALGIGAIALSLVLYCLRASLLQARYMRSQQKLMESERALMQANERLHELSFKDSLTQVANRRKFDQTLEMEWARAQRTGQPLSLLMIDIDHFKNLNDRYGHVAGDECLVAVARALNGTLRRAGDLLARYGGEEFVAILANIESEHALHVAEVMRQAVAELKIPNEGAPTGSLLTVSVGVVTQTEYPHHDAEALLEAGDKALYRAKCLGRNRVEVATPHEDTAISAGPQRER